VLGAAIAMRLYSRLGLEFTARPGHGFLEYVRDGIEEYLGNMSRVDANQTSVENRLSANDHQKAG
jgi:hypothetical protein